jgi:hypothetical protein
MFRKARKGARRTATHKTKLIPAAYTQVVAQLTAEARHGNVNQGHEARRRQTYARKVLDLFAEELLSYHRSEEDFRSFVLTPILARMLSGLTDVYLPQIVAAVSQGRPTITTEDAVRFYLTLDPVDPAYIPYYRRNLLYIPEARWHLGVTLGRDTEKKANPTEYHNRFRVNHDRILDANATDPLLPPPDGSPPLLRRTEVRTLQNECISRFFWRELELVVCTTPTAVLLY